ncbi:MAG: AMP-binding protein [Firmicutes bacterium]|nr:AMP-binding protein [Bacillota bacterium]
MNYSVHDVIEANYDKFGNDPYIYEYSAGGFVPHSYKQFADDVHSFAAYLQGLGLSSSHIGIYSENSYGYMVADAAIMGYVGVSVCMSKDWEFFDVNNAVGYINLKALIYSEKKSAIVNKIKEKYPDIIYIPMSEVTQTRDCRVTTSEVDTSLCCKIIFSSGTTGMPKAVMLSQNNMFSGWENLYKRAPMNHSDRCYLFLPLNHTYASVCTFLYSMISGMSIYLCSNAANIMKELIMVRPTVFCSVPLILERIYKACSAGALNPNDIMGGCIKYLFCGGAHLDGEVKRYFRNNNINLLNAYALSETSSILSIEYPNDDDMETVGTIFENIEVIVDNQDENGVGEIKVRGDNVFLGYYGNEVLTAKAFDENGYFITGDLGYVVGNKLYVVGRKKRVIVMPNGENVYPDDVGNLFEDIEHITKVKVFEKDNKLFANIYVNQYIDCKGIIAEVNSNLPRFSRIKGYEVIIDAIDVRYK